MTAIEHKVSCPFCGHQIFIQIESEQQDETFYQDCSACCNPVHLVLHVDEVHHKVQLLIDADDEQYY